MSTRRIVLASASPRRRELLTSIGLGFEVRPAAIDESPFPGEAPRDHVERVSLDKVRAVGKAGEIVLAADTVVVIDGAILGKPRDTTDAQRMLRLLQGREHQVLTGVVLREVGDDGRAHGDAPRHREVKTVEQSTVRLRPLDAAEIEWYVATGEPADKAGAYALQGIGGLFVTAVSGSSSNVIGLPLHVVWELFERLGYDLRDFRAIDTLPRS